MGRLCVNQYNGISLEDATTPRCIADWAHIQEQVLYALVLWGVLMVIALAWTAASHNQSRQLRGDEIDFSLRLRRWARTSRTAALINRPIQLLTSAGIFFFMINRCNSYEVSQVGYILTSVLYVIALVDACVRFLAARYKVLYCFAPLTILETLMVASHCQIGLGSTTLISGVLTRSWLDFSIMRPIFILRSYLEMEKHLPRSSRGWMMGRLAVKVILLIIFGASIMFFLETLGEMPFFTQNGFAHLYKCSDTGIVTRNNTECQDETWSIMFSFYFTVVTLGTVGYGDSAPKTVLSRLLAIMFIVMGVILFSLEIENIINLYKSRQIGNPPYRPPPDSRHVIIMGNPSFSQLASILRELFHEDHTCATDDVRRIHAVVLGERKSKFTKGLVAKLEADPIFAAQVTYVAGNPTKTEDLDRALAQDAEAVFVFPDKLSEDPANEDALNIMRVLATRRHCGPDVRCLVMVLRAESARHMLAAGVHRDDVICENVIKMGTLAQSTISHGASTMLANLAASLSVEGSAEAPSERKLAHLDRVVATTVRHKTRADVARRRHWLKEYYHGVAKEMYLIKLSKNYAGLTFAEAASRIFSETEGNVVLIAVEVVFPGTDVTQSNISAGDSRVLLNPGSSLIMAEWMQCYVVADDLAHVFKHKICPDVVTREELMRAPGSPSTMYNELADTFVDKGDLASEVEHDDNEAYQNVTAYAPLRTPTRTSNFVDATTVPEPTQYEGLRQQRGEARAGHGAENVLMDRSLRAIALNFSDTIDGPFGGMGGQNIDLSINYNAAGRSIDAALMLESPPLNVLLDPKHIVVCSFLGEESLASLLWFILPLRGAYSDDGNPPITILDAAEPTHAVTTMLSAFPNVYYMRGSPLVYADLQRSGAKAAATVIVLGKRAKAGLLQTAGDTDVETSIIDAEAIFSTMLIALKMDFTKIFTITELSDESNSKFLGTSFQLRQFNGSVDGVEHSDLARDKAIQDESSNSLSWWEYLLLNGIPQQKSEKAIFGMPLYMSGRLLHPELCENMLVQTFYNPSIHKIIRQLVGGARCTGVIRSFALPAKFQKSQNQVTYGDVFHAFASSSFAGICLGVYRWSTQTTRSGHQVELPIVLVTQKPGFELVKTDRLFVLIGIHTLARAAACIQRFYRRRRSRRAGPRSSSSPDGSIEDSDARSRISLYLSPLRDSFEAVAEPTSQRRSQIAQEGTSSFTSYYV